MHTKLETVPRGVVGSALGLELHQPPVIKASGAPWRPVKRETQCLCVCALDSSCSSSSNSLPMLLLRTHLFPDYARVKRSFKAPACADLFLRL